MKTKKKRTIKAKRGSWLYCTLRAPLYWTEDRAKVDKSPYPYAPLFSRRTGGPIGWYSLSLLGILHRWFGVVLWVPDER